MSESEGGRQSGASAAGAVAPREPETELGPDLPSDQPAPDAAQQTELQEGETQAPPACTLHKDRPRVVVVGGGFGGLKALQKLRGSGFCLTLVDRANYHTFLPLLYQVGAAELDAETIAYPLRGILRDHKDVHFVMAEVTGADLERQVLHTSGPEIPYDYLIVAAGSVHHYFGVPGAAEYALPLKTLEHGTSLRSHILDRFEWASHEPHEALRRRALTFTIVGAGPTGVEYAGALAELIYGPLRRDYPTLDFREVRIVLLEGSHCVLSGFPMKLSEYALKRLGDMRVDVRLNARVAQVTPTSVCLDGGEEIPTETVVWTAGVRGSPIAQHLGLETTRGGRVRVEPTLQVPGHPAVYLVGDLAEVRQGDEVLPMIAPVAMQEGEAAAANILRQARGEPLAAFQYKDPGIMATIGRNKAVAQLAGRCFTGFPAWVLWLTVHLMKLIGFRNRLLVLIDWAWDYLFFERTQRLILPMRRRAPGERMNAPTKAQTTTQVK